MLTKTKPYRVGWPFLGQGLFRLSTVNPVWFSFCGGRTMADFWIKVCKDTPDKSELVILSERLEASHGDVFLWWFRLWAWADGQTADGFLPHLNVARIAKAARVPETFCHALGSEDVAWLYPVDATKTRPAGMMFAKWDRHNGKSAKKRALDSQRQRNCRKSA